MVKEYEILPLMIRDHCKIENLLDKLEESTQIDFEEMKKAFYKLEWNLEKHIFLEEKVVFTMYSPDEVSEGYKMLPKLTEQHNYILNTLENWRSEIRHKRILKEIYKLKEYLVKHKEFEEMEFYPKLDENLKLDQKILMHDRLTEIILS